MPKYRHIEVVVPPGEYDVTVETAMLKRSKKGNEMIVLQLSAGAKNRWFLEHLVFAEKSYWKIAQFLMAMGHNITGDEEIDPFDYVGRTARAVVDVHEFGGRSQNKIQQWLPPRESTVAEVIEAPTPTAPDCLIDTSEANEERPDNE